MFSTGIRIEVHRRLPWYQMSRLQVILGILLAGLIPLCASCRASYCLELLDGQSGALIKTIAIKEGETFTVKFIHSVEKGPILESFYIDRDGNIVLKEVKFKKIGVGYGKYIPTLYPSAYKDGWYYMKDINVPAVLNYRVGYIADHTLVVRDRDYSFKEMIPSGELLKIVARKITDD